MTAVLALAFEVLGPKHWNVAKHLAAALAVVSVGATVDLPSLYVVREVVLIAMPTEALGSRPNRAAVLSIFQVAPVHVQAIFAGLSHLGLIRFKLGFIHGDAPVGVPHNLFVLDVCLHVLGTLPIQKQSFHL